jgi:hypothetical protein
LNEAEARIVARIDLGLCLSDAAQAVGVPASTARSWLARGRAARHGPHADFAAAVERARAQAERVSTAPMSEAELRAKLTRMVRLGSIRAARIYWGILRADRAGTRVSQAR